MVKLSRACLAIALYSGFSLASCGSSIDSSLKLAPTPLLSRGPGWAVVRVAYARLKERPSIDARDLAPLRRGSVVELEGRERGNPERAEDRGLWYRLDTEGTKGFARESEFDVYSSREQAERAAKGYD